MATVSELVPMKRTGEKPKLKRRQREAAKGKRRQGERGVWGVEEAIVPEEPDEDDPCLSRVRDLENQEVTGSPNKELTNELQRKIMVSAKMRKAEVERKRAARLEVERQQTLYKEVH